MSAELRLDRGQSPAHAIDALQFICTRFYILDERMKEIEKASGRRREKLHYVIYD